MDWILIETANFLRQYVEAVDQALLSNDLINKSVLLSWPLALFGIIYGAIKFW